jgi:hypothetical protein
LQLYISCTPSFRPCPSTYFLLSPEHTFVLDRTLFARAITIAPHLFSDGLFGMVYQHFSRCFILEDPSLRFSELFQAIVIVVCGDIFSLVALVLRISKLLVTVKDIGGLRSIVIGEAFL